MLPSSNRLSVKEFNEVLEKGRVVHNPLFWLRTINSTDKTQVSVICPKKVGKNAVIRNRFRRIVYRLIQEDIFTSLVNSKNIICLKDPVIKANSTDLSQNLKDIFVKAKLLK